MKLTIRKRRVGNIPLLEVVEENAIYEPLPLLVYYHGWQTAKELVLTQGRKLARAGFRVILPDAANHGERKAQVSEIPSLTFWNSIQTNLFEFGYLVDYFENLGLSNGELYVGGVSMGGMTTCALLTQHPTIKAAACVMGSPAPVTYRQRITTHATAAGFYLPKDYQTLLSWIEAYDLSLHPETLGERPLFFWHGTTDQKIPIEQVTNFVDHHPEKLITFIQEEEGHLVKVATMEQVTTFFVNARNLAK
ncbi:alpha/beta fold hydrolase [Enterococcus sp. JM9B]|uniref:alpha/beta fold hydrolase n=1 Tax=Enterococcus sp. JM9B TaxID=1857216 RepID=UPI001374FE58|nr:alpha/beta fold hydrolase [Enterococcus sp. JM9B]KAF1299984.1 esterase [Enterococcus sp. JM9B]